MIKMKDGVWFNKKFKPSMMKMKTWMKLKDIRLKEGSTLS